MRRQTADPRPSLGEQLGSLRTLVAEDLHANGGDWTRRGFRALFVYRCGVARQGFPMILRKPVSLFCRLAQRHVRNSYGIEIYDTAWIGRRVRLASQGAIVMHANAVIGDDCVIGGDVTLGAIGERDLHSHPVLGRRVEVGAGAVIVGGVSVGDDARISPNAVVLSRVAAGAQVPAAPPCVQPADATRA